MNTTVTANIFEVSPAQAQTWLLENNYKKQRAIRSDHVSYLEREIKEGRFIKGTMIHFARMNDVLYLVNGQHTLSAMVKAKTSLPLTIAVTDVCSENEIAQLYFRHDNHLSRTISDAFRSLGLEEDTGLCLSEQQWVGSAITVIMGGFTHSGRKGNRVSRDDLANGVRTLAVPARFYFDAIKGNNSAIVRTMTVRATVAVALTACLYCSDVAVDFFSQVASGDGLKTGDPRKTLREFLLCVGSQGGGLTHKRAVAVAYQCRAIAVAWNAFVEDRSLKLIKVMDQSAPIKLLGTPYHGDGKKMPDLLRDAAMRFS